MKKLNVGSYKDTDSIFAEIINYKPKYRGRYIYVKRDRISPYDVRNGNPRNTIGIIINSWQWKTLDGKWHCVVYENDEIYLLDEVETLAVKI